jgi:hypothetical protein
MQTTSIAHKVYELDHNLDLYDGYPYDLGLIDEFKDYRKIPSGFWHPAPITVGGTEGSLVRKQLPNGKWTVTEMHIPESAKYWWGVESVLQETGYPYSKYGSSWPIMSKRMLEVLLSVRDFPHQTIAIDIKDATQVADVERGIGLKDSGIHNHNFVIVQLLEQLDIFDWEQSVYEPDTISSSSFTVGEINKMVLKEPETGFPPLFRVTINSTRLYVSAAARAALEAAGIGGVKFRNLAGA